MLKKLSFCLLLAMGLTACSTVEEKPGVQPEKLPLTLKDGKLTCDYVVAEGETPVLFSVRKDQLGPVFRIRFGEGEQSKVNETIPAGAKWLQVFGIDFQLPAENGAQLNAFDVDGKKIFFFAYDLIESESGEIWNGQLVVDGQNHFFHFLVAKDGQIFNVKVPGVRDGGWKTYTSCYEFKNQDGNLAVWNGKDWILTTIELCPYKPDPMMCFELNLPDIRKHLAEMQKKQGLFRCMTTDEFKNFCDRALGLKAGMTPDEVKTILGEPFSDQITMAPKGPVELQKRYRTLTYYFVKKEKTGVNLYVDSPLDLRFVTGEDGTERLEKSY